MGYLTRYDLEYEPLDRDLDRRIGSNWTYGEAIRKAIDMNDTLQYVGGGDSMKWYDHEDDMRGFSEAFPEALFILHGSGEEAGDIWTKYFVGGKMQTAKAVVLVDKFDPSKLE